ncbi:MAG: hypothetical protein MjAS7_2099 [Metallosphaera javensis (ex Sakai et al. 2022)]|nr:MAG: hypothetical protein MjAS7_2099 [Metallosphaera javensis (ex Sakai et al. 2022)]
MKIPFTLEYVKLGGLNNPITRRRNHFALLFLHRVSGLKDECAFEGMVFNVIIDPMVLLNPFA